VHSAIIENIFSQLCEIAHSVMTENSLLRFPVRAEEFFHLFGFLSSVEGFSKNSDKKRLSDFLSNFYAGVLGVWGKLKLEEMVISFFP